MTTPVDVFGKSDWTRAHPRHLHQQITALYNIRTDAVFLCLFLILFTPNFVLDAGRLVRIVVSSVSKPLHSFVLYSVLNVNDQVIMEELTHTVENSLV